MAKIYNTTKNVSMLVCFEGCNRRVVIDPKKCNVDKKNKTFSYKGLYKADNGNTYLISATSVGGYKTNVIVSNRSGKQVIAERHNVDVRFGRYLFD